jgi:hypothetical protein
MDIKTFTQMYGDKHTLDLIKLKYKYGENYLSEFIETLKDCFYTKLSLYDFNHKNIVYLPSKGKFSPYNP